MYFYPYLRNRKSAHKSYFYETLFIYHALDVRTYVVIEKEAPEFIIFNTYKKEDSIVEAFTCWKSIINTVSENELFLDFHNLKFIHSWRSHFVTLTLSNDKYNLSWDIYCVYKHKSDYTSHLIKLYTVYRTDRHE